MANELTLSLTTPVEQLIPAMIAWNNNELMSLVQDMLGIYKGKEYSDEQIAEAKDTRAKLNAFITNLRDERIRIGKVYSSPYDKFKSEVDAVQDAVKAVADEIGAQIKAYEERKKAEKLVLIKEYYYSAIGKYNGLVNFDERIMQAKWLNAGTSMKAVKEAINKVVDDIDKAMAAIESIESKHENKIKAFYFRTLDLPAALEESKRLVKEEERMAELAELTKKTGISHDVPLQTIRAVLEITANTRQFAELKKYLTDNGIKLHRAEPVSSN